MRFTRLALAALLALAPVLGCSVVPSPTVPPGSDAAADRVPDRVLITLKPAPPAIWSRITFELAQNYGLRTVFAWTMVSLGEQCVVFEIPEDRSRAEILRRLGSDPRVGIAQPVETFEVLGEEATAYNDPYAHLQHSVQDLRLAQAHRWATGKGVRVALIDTGVDVDHPDLRGRVVKVGNFVDRPGQEFTSDVHGTAVAGVLAAATNNQVGIVGVAPRAELYALKACWPRAQGAREAVCDSYTLARAVDFAIVEGAQILNFSLTGPRDPLLARLLGAALQRGIVVVAADPGDGRPSFPSGLEGVLGVLGSIGVAPSRASPSGLSASAEDILATVPRGSYDFFSGSSFAAAQVAGVAALLLEREPGLTPARLAERIRRTARALPVGTGTAAALTQVDACAALAEASGQGSCP